MAALNEQAEIGGETDGGDPSVHEADNRWISDGGPSDNAIITRDEHGRFQDGTVANPAGLFKPGRSGNPAGRPHGSGRRAGALVAAELLDGKAGEITEKAMEMALAGDPVAVRFCLGRILGNRRGQPVEIDLPPVTAPRDLLGAVSAVTGALADVRLTPDEARACSQMLDRLPGLLAAGRAGMPEWRRDGDAEDPRKALMRKLARLAKSVENEKLDQARALETIPAPARPLDVAVAEHQEQHQQEQQQSTDAEPAAIAVTRIAPAAAAEQQ